MTDKDRKAVQGANATGWKGKAQPDLQNSKLAGSDDKDGGEHEPNADSKHCQGGEQEAAKDE
jgi:hypothetical protein